MRHDRVASSFSVSPTGFKDAIFLCSKDIGLSIDDNALVADDVTSSLVSAIGVVVVVVGVVATPAAAAAAAAFAFALSSAI